MSDQTDRPAMGPAGSRRSGRLRETPSAGRRSFVQAATGLAIASFVPVPGRAQSADPELVARQLPLAAVGLEHIGTVVPDATAAARFFGRVFNPLVYKEMEPPLRYYVTLDPGYIALGTRDDASGAFIDHDCVLVDGYDRAAMSARLEQQGLAPGRFGVIPDPDGLRLQLLPLGGLAASTEPAGRIVSGEPLLRPRGLHRVLRYVSDLQASRTYYRTFFGQENRRGASDEATWFQVGPTLFGIAQAPVGVEPRIDRFCVNVAAGEFDPETIAEALAALGARVESTADDELLRFRSPEGIGVELRPVDPARLWGRT